MQEQQREATKAIAERNTAVAELKILKRNVQELENVRATKHATKTFAPDALGHGSPNAGGAKAKSRRFEVLDRLARLKAGLSPAKRTIGNGSSILGARQWFMSIKAIGDQF